MSLGMTWTDFWEGEPAMAAAFRKAAKLRNEREDTIAWLNGLYVYEAIAKLAPIFNAFSKAEPDVYPDKPLHTRRDEQAAVEREARVMDKAREHMEVYSILHNVQMGEEQG